MEKSKRTSLPGGAEPFGSRLPFSDICGDGNGRALEKIFGLYRVFPRLKIEHKIPSIGLLAGQNKSK